LKFLTATVFAHLGVARAQCALAFMYFDREGVRRNPEQAAHWARKAAARGNTRAQLLLSNLKIAGFGTPKDFAGALALAQQAAQGKDPGALNSLAWFHMQGVGTAVDKERAFALYMEAAHAGDPASQCAVAYCLLEGSGTDRDVPAARDWCELAIRNGYRDEHCSKLLQRAHAELGTTPFDTAKPPAEVPERPWLVVQLDLFATALRYGFLGLDEHTYRLRQSRTYERAKNYNKAAEHARRVLAIAEDVESRTRLALSCSMLRQDADAVREYRKVAAEWDHPAIVLALAQAELRVGNVETARVLMERVQKSQLAHYLGSPIRDLQTEMAAASESSRRRPR